MLSHQPFDGLGYWEADNITITSVVPNASGAGDDELAASNNEGVHPEEAEDLVEEHVAYFVFPFYFSDKLELFTGLGFTTRK